MSALHFAANAGHLDIVNVLIEASALINVKDEVSLLQCAVKSVIVSISATVLLCFKFFKIAIVIFV